MRHLNDNVRPNGDEQHDYPSCSKPEYERKQETKNRRETKGKGNAQGKMHKERLKGLWKKHARKDPNKIHDLLPILLLP